MSVTALINPESFLARNAMGTTIKAAIGYLAGPNPYATGGFAADVATDLSISGTIDKVFVVAEKGNLGALWHAGTAKVKCYSALNTELGAEDLSTDTFFLIVLYHD